MSGDSSSLYPLCVGPSYISVHRHVIELHLPFGHVTVYNQSHSLQAARSFDINQLLNENEEKLEEYYRQKYANTTSTKLVQY